MRCLGVSETRERQRGATHVETALDAEAYTALETLPGMLVVVEVLIVPSESEPGGAKPIPCSRFVVPECSTWVVGDERRERAGRLQERTERDGFRDVGRELGVGRRIGGRDREGGGDLEDERDGGVRERLEGRAV